MPALVLGMAWYRLRDMLADGMPPHDRPAALPQSRRRPVVLVPACNRMLGEHPFHVARRKYVDAVRLAGACRWWCRAPSRRDRPLLDLADGVLLTGSVSNVHPSHFDEGRCTTRPCRWTRRATPGRCR
jgi:hypothetical protein